VSSIVGTLAKLGLASVSSLCARVAWAIEDGGLNASPEGLARTPPSQLPGILPAPSSPCHALVSPLPRCMTLLPLSRTPFVPFAPARERSSCTHARLVAARGGCRLPDAILRGKRSLRPRGRAVQPLARLNFE
jgi:hypothetical protein